MGTMTAAQFVSLKSKCDTEWKRRKYYGSMVNYAGKAFTETPATGKKIYAQQGNLVMTPFAEKISTHGNLKTATAGVTKLGDTSDFDNTTITNWLTTLSGKSLTTSSHGCSGACSGLCSTSCGNACTGCTACTSCSNACDGCTGCTGCQGCDGCTGCSNACDGCTGCTSCSGCSGCSGCSDQCTGCTGGCNGMKGCNNCGPCTGCLGGPGCTSGCKVSCSTCSGCSGYAQGQ